MNPTFPTDVPKEAIKQIYSFATRQDPNLGKAALAAWQVLGYAGHLAFGSVSLDNNMPLSTALPPDQLHKMVGDASESGSIPPELIDLAISIFVRWLKTRFGTP